MIINSLYSRRILSIDTLFWTKDKFTIVYIYISSRMNNLFPPQQGSSLPPNHTICNLLRKLSTFLVYLKSRKAQIFPCFHSPWELFTDLFPCARYLCIIYWHFDICDWNFQYLTWYVNLSAVSHHSSNIYGNISIHRNKEGIFMLHKIDKLNIHSNTINQRGSGWYP